MKSKLKVYACLDIAQITALLSIATRDSIERYGAVVEYSTVILRFPLGDKILASKGALQASDFEMTVNGLPLSDESMKIRETMKAVSKL